MIDTHGHVKIMDFGLARFYEEAGDVNLSVNRYRRFLKLRDEAAPELPEGTDARQRVEKVTSESTTRL